MPADDDAASGPPPHPLDRTWLHPTELGGSGGPAAGSPGPDRPARSPRSRVGAPVRVVGVTVAVGLVATVGVLLLAGTGPGDRATPPAGRVAAAAPGGTTDRPVPASASVVAVTRPGPDGEMSTAGSGVVVASRRIVSAAHLVTGVAGIGVVTADGRTLTTTVVGTDPDTDLVLLKVAEDLVPITVAPDPRLEVGSPVTRVHHPAANPTAVTTGTVTAVDVYTEGTDRFVVGLVRTEPRTDAGPGGAVLDRSGHLAGILVGDGDAVPSDVVRDVVVQLAHGGRAYHGALRVPVVDATERARGGARAVADARADGTARIRRDDVVVAVAGRPVDSAAALAALVRRLRPGDPVEVVVERGGERLRLGVVLVPSPTDVDPDGPLVA